MSVTSSIEDVDRHVKSLYKLPTIAGQLFSNDLTDEKLLKAEEVVKQAVIKEFAKENIGLGRDELELTNKFKDMRALTKLASTLGFSSPDSKQNQELFYGVYIPNDIRLQCGEEPVHVYTDKLEALKVMKQSKKARFKQFKTFQEAVEFARNGAEVIPTPAAQQSLVAEKPVSFKGPKPQDMVQFRKAIEAGDIDSVRAAIDSNPRYLFSSGDTPSILQEGCRYNALHVAAKTNQAAIAELVLTSVTSIPLLARLYEDQDEDALKQRSAVLLDLYLNMPDKSCNETPLHFAVKYGAVEMVELLTSYPECQRGLVNKYGATVRDLVCTRISDEGGTKKAAILAFLDERFFLPVLRYEDNSLQPRIGEPFSPAKPLDIPSNPLSPRLEMHAFAGPMSKCQVDEFRKKWRTPPAFMRKSALQLKDPEKGLERVGRNLAHELKIPWQEYWSFLDTFVDLSSSKGLALLEKYLSKRFDVTFEEMMSPVSEAPETESPSSLEVLSPISSLCQVFQACSLDDKKRSPARETPVKWKIAKEKKLKKEKSFHAGNDEIGTEVRDGNQHFSSLLYLERFCQVFGKRIANIILNVSSTADVSTLRTESLKDCLQPEVKQLQSRVTPYLEDSRFSGINFNVIHSRVAACAASEAKFLVTPSELTLIIACLREISMADGTMSDDEEIIFNNRRDIQYNMGAGLKTHLLCLTECLVMELTLAGPKPASIQSDADCQILWARAYQCACKWEAPSSHIANSRISWRRKKTQPKHITFHNDDEGGSSMEESWRSCEEPTHVEEEVFVTPPSSPIQSLSDPVEELNLEDTISMPDTFIYPGNAPSKTDLAVLDAISDCHITSESHPFIYRWRHLVKLHEDKVLPCGQTAPSPGAWHRRRLVPSSPAVSSPRSLDSSLVGSPRRPEWERVAGPYSPRRSIIFSPR